MKIRTFVNSDTGDEVRFDKAKPGRSGYSSKDHYHRFNPNDTGDIDKFLDAKGILVRKTALNHIYSLTR